MPIIKLIKQELSIEDKLYYIQIDNEVIEETKCNHLSNALHYYEMHKSTIKPSESKIENQLYSQLPIVLMQETI